MFFAPFNSTPFFKKPIKPIKYYLLKLSNLMVCFLNEMLFEHKNAKRKQSKFFFNLNVDLLGQNDVGTATRDYQVK